MGRSGQDARRMAELVAVVDLGSTAVRFLIAKIVPGSRYRVLVGERVPTRLGAGRPGILPRDAIDETLRAVHRFFSRYSKDAWGPRVVAVATSAVREARNRERLLGPLRRREGIDVRVLSARDEARFGVYAALDSLSFKDGVVADLGGASFQLSRVRDRKVVSIASVPLGAVRTSSLFLRHERPRPRELQACRLGFARSSWALCLRPVAARSWWGCRDHSRAGQHSSPVPLGRAQAPARASDAAVRRDGDPGATRRSFAAKAQEDSGAQGGTSRHYPLGGHGHRGGHDLRGLPDSGRLYARSAGRSAPARNIQRSRVISVQTHSSIANCRGWSSIGGCWKRRRTRPCRCSSA